MPNVKGPVLVREHDLPRPGEHAHNLGRRDLEHRPGPRRWLLIVRNVLLLLGLGGVGYYGYEIGNRYVYQAYENWAFDQQISGRARVTFTDYVRERTPFGFLAGARRIEPAESAPTAKGSGAPAASRPESGSVLGRVEIARLNLSAMVREGVDSATLSRAVGHVPSTSLPGQRGNFAIAAHRDTLFRALKDIHDGDLVEFQSPAGTYKYEVFSTKIVRPSEVSVLRPDGGNPGWEPAAAHEDALLTMITCYPFYYVGSAPKRFIVQARLVSGGGVTPKPAEAINEPGGPPKTGQASIPITPVKRRPSRQVGVQGLRYLRGSSRLRRVAHVDKAKKHGLWHKIFHSS